MINSKKNDNARAEIGYDIAKISWGMCYAPEGIRTLIKNAFEDLQLNRIEEAKVEHANLNSIKVLQKLIRKI